MSFIDKVKVSVKAGDGGNGKLSFRQEKFVDKGGPDGGDAGHGADVILVGSRNQNTLAAFRYQKELKGEDGQGGGKSNMHGRSAKHLLVPVPVGTIATNEKGEVIADLAVDGQEVVIAKGGKGGFGNAHFVSSRRQAPKFAEKGEPGDKLANVTLEIKMIADVGLVGMPNAGKSTLLATISNARPEIADYPFTTLRPSLGVVDISDGYSLLMADIPGLIEGAAEGKGLGHDFLRHVERTAVILHLIDAYQDDVAAAYKTIRSELEAYGTQLANLPEIVTLTKVEGLDAEIVADLMTQLQAVVPAETPMFAISSQAGTGLKELKYELKDAVATARAKMEELKPVEPTIPVLRITDTSDEWQVERTDRGFNITGQRIERFAKRTDFDNEESVERLRDIMRKVGITHELVRQNVKIADIITFNEFGKFSY